VAYDVLTADSDCSVDVAMVTNVGGKLT